ncbi:hypothetical protein PtB15_14B331 [Puccinia triticina]|nr:hypothetical protein PtB15_14B331 [Puccinia triticina]
MHPPSPALPPPKFHLHRTDCSYGLWIQTITALANRFLLPLDNEQWYCPDLIDFPKLAAFGDKDSEKRPGSFIPTVTKTPHPESTIFHGLFRLLHPPQRLHTDWARIRLHSVDVLHEFRNVIIDVLMAYIILQTHYLSKAPLTAAEKKANLCANQTPLEGTTASPAPVKQTPSALATESAEATQSLKKYQQKQNYQPLVYFVLAGVRGLFITSRDHRIAGLSTCMSFIQAMSIIKQHTTTTHAPDEPIWKNLSAYLFQVFLPVFQSLDKICPLNNVKVPTRVELEEAITSDFLNQWQEWNPTSSFLLLHTTPQIAGPAH